MCISLLDELEFWELTVNGGSQWKVEDMPGDCGYDFCNDGVTKYFATSFEWVLFLLCEQSHKNTFYGSNSTIMCPRLCLKRQLIDLLAEDYSSEQLDTQPAVTVEDW